jgi:hypothetical protein
VKFNRSKLEALLGRVQYNAGLSRGARVVASPVPPLAAVPSSAPLELDEPGLDSLAPSAHARASNELELDEPPESGSARVRGAQLLDRADDADDRPPMTPPPESGEEPAPKVSIPRDPGPTMAQLGQTIALEEAAGGALELDEPAPPPSVRGTDQLSMSSLPAPGLGYSEELPLPENAREELDRVRLGQSAEVGPTIHGRPVLSTNVVDFVSAVRSHEPETFLALLDASLSL